MYGDVPSSLHSFIQENIGVHSYATRYASHMMTSSNGNIFRVTDPLCGEFTGPGEFPTQRPVTRSFDVFFDLCLNKPLSLWLQCNDIDVFMEDCVLEYIAWKSQIQIHFLKSNNIHLFKIDLRYYLIDMKWTGK